MCSWPTVIAVIGLVSLGCSSSTPASAPKKAPTFMVTPQPFTNDPGAWQTEAPQAAASARTDDDADGALIAESRPLATAPCSPANWIDRGLGPILAPGRLTSGTHPDQPGSGPVELGPGCGDDPNGASLETPQPLVVAGVAIRVIAARPAGRSERGWQGNQCEFELQMAEGGGRSVVLGYDRVPPFTTIGAVLRTGSAAWISLSFNGYTAEFPRGGNRIVALDLCEGRVVWQSKDSVSNDGLLLFGDYLMAPFGFTRERRFVHVLDAYSGRLIQKLPVIENICPSKSWAPNHRPGDRCDAPGQAVGAATRPRVEEGSFVVDTNTGSSAFRFLQ